MLVIYKKCILPAYGLTRLFLMFWLLQTFALEGNLAGVKGTRLLGSNHTTSPGDKHRQEVGL
jgi:hypothetical protein